MTAHTLLLRTLVWYFKLVPLPESFERIASAETTPVVVTQSDSLIIEALLASIASRRGLRLERLPQHQVSTQDRRGVLWWCSMHDDAALAALLAHHSEYPVTTLNLFHVRGPVRSNPSYRMNFIRLWRVFIGGQFLFIIFGEPFALAATLHGHLSVKRLRRALKLDFYRNLKLIRGTPFQALDVQEREVLRGAEFERELSIVAQRSFGGRHHAEGDTRAIERARDAARKEFYTVAAHPRRIMYGIVAPLTKFLLNRLFTSVTAQGLEHVAKAVRSTTVVLVPMHRSHLDYIIVGSLLYHSNMNPALVAAGVNLNFWPVGPVVRSLGAYFVRRESRNNRIHALVLRRYVKYLTKRGHLQEFFIEGGRSRTGRMRPPKVGILSMLVDSWVSGDRRDLHFVPVSISYENVVEEREFEQENTGASKVRESLLGLIRARSIFKRKYGDAIVRFGEAISLRDYTADMQRPGGLPSAEIKSFIQRLGLTLTLRIRDQANISFSALTYSALLMAPRYGLTRRELVSTIRGLSTIIDALRRANPRIGAPTPSLSHFLAGKTSLLDDIVNSGVVQRGIIFDEELFFVPGKRRYNADFYRNGIVHLFVIPALFAISELLQGAIHTATLHRLRSILAYDFLLAEEVEFERELAAVRAALEAHGIVSSEGRFSEHKSGIFVPRILLGTLEAYLWTYENLLRCPAGLQVEVASPEGLPALSFPRFLDHLQATFKSGAYHGVVSRTEAASRNILVGVLESLHSRRLVQLQDQNGKHDVILVLSDLREETSFLRSCVEAVRAWSGEKDHFPERSRIQRSAPD